MQSAIIELRFNEAWGRHDPDGTLVVVNLFRSTSSKVSKKMWPSSCAIVIKRSVGFNLSSKVTRPARAEHGRTCIRG